MTTRPRVLLTTTAAAVALMGGLAGPSLAVAPAAEPGTESRVGTTGLGSADGVRYKKATVQIPGDDSGNPTTSHVRARCNDGWKAISGGQTIGVKPQHAISDGIRGEDEYYYASAWQYHDLPAKLTAYVICVKTNALTADGAAETNVPANSQVTDAAWCDEGHAVGGGLNHIGNRSDFSLNSSSPIDSPSDADTRPDDGWQAYTHYSGPGGNGDGALITVQCLGGSAPAYRTKTVTVPDKEEAYATARCPKGNAVHGGGVYVDGAAISSKVVASRPWDSGDAGTVPDDGLRAGILSNAHYDLTMTVHAICR